ncbi:hypothetical protein GGF32_004820 [Allomyces javanicus]|nr:hypothetical protein GGF32_004820 [Allomyces javanicus]
MTTSRAIRKRNEKFAAASSGIPLVAPAVRPRGLAASAVKSRSLTGKKWAISGHALFFMILLVGPAVLAIARLFL